VQEATLATNAVFVEVMLPLSMLHDNVVPALAGPEMVTTLPTATAL